MIPCISAKSYSQLASKEFLSKIHISHCSRGYGSPDNHYLNRVYERIMNMVYLGYPKSIIEEYYTRVQGPVRGLISNPPPLSVIIANLCLGSLRLIKSASAYLDADSLDAIATKYHIAARHNRSLSVKFMPYGRQIDLNMSCVLHRATQNGSRCKQHHRR